MTDRQRAFVAAYFADPRRNASKAAAAAGYRWPQKQGWRLRHSPGVREAIDEEEARRLAACRERWRAERAAAERAWAEWHRALPRRRRRRRLA